MVKAMAITAAAADVSDVSDGAPIPAGPRRFSRAGQAVNGGVEAGPLANPRRTRLVDLTEAPDLG
jgi:hypothetical protein